jgi:hypothetical protein
MTIKVRSLEEMSGTILWMINRLVFHPLGYALTLYDAPATGWAILGTGTEPWAFEEETDQEGFDEWHDFLRLLAEENAPDQLPPHEETGKIEEDVEIKKVEYRIFTDDGNEEITVERKL